MLHYSYIVCTDELHRFDNWNVNCWLSNFCKMLHKSSGTKGKRAGFNGQRAIVLPKKITQTCIESAISKHLFITDIGFYPKARFHYCKRPVGISQNILIYCIDGKGWIEANGEEVEVKSGQCVIIPANMSHQYGSDEKDPWSIYWLHFKGSSANEYVSLISKQRSRIVVPVDFLEERVRLFESMYSTLESGYSADNLGYINSCLWYFLSSFCFEDIFRSPLNKRVEKDAIDISIEFMQKNLHRTLTILELANEAHISPSHYATLFKKKTGYPPLEYFNHIKIQKACQYLHFSTLQIKEIAYEIGISDPYYFSRFFSNIMGVSPLEYRKKKH